nr:unnamed protein product [Callosobruchus chinensis]
MAGKKKKNLASKLAKMSDEERARYLQHRAEIEEEAKRRKEQLIATFMKKKIKREEAFGRLNVAKINQNWHQILRKAKCKEMKEDVEHMRKWIDRVINHKNKTIAKLMEELEQAEEQYLNNFQSHSKHIDEIIEHQHQYIEKLKSEYESDLNDLIAVMDKEKQDISINAIEEEKHLQMILYGQERLTATKDRKEYEEYKQKCFEAECPPVAATVS